MKKYPGWLTFLSVLTLMALALVEWVHFAVPHELHGGAWNQVPGWDLVFGVAGGLVLFLLGAWILKPLLTRPEDYYREGGDR